MNEIYIVDGQKFDVAPNRKEEFLKKYPNATLYIEPTIPEDMGKITPPQVDVMGAAVEETKVPDTDSKQEGISLELPKDEEPGIVKSLAATTVKGIANFFRGTQAQLETVALSTYAGIREGLMNDPMSTDEKIAFRKALAMGVPGSNVMGTAQYDGVINDLNEHIRKTESEGVTDALTKGKYGEAAYLATSGMLESLPSVAASFLGVGGLVLLGGSVAGNKFDEEFEANPEESLNRIALNAVGTGVTEATFERFTMGLAGRAKAALGSGKKGAAESAKKILEEGFFSVGKRLGLDIGGEALSEGATEAANIAVDYLTLDRELPTDQILKRISDGAIIGGLMGGTLSSVSAIGNNSSAARNRAEYILTPDADKKEMQKSAAKISNLALDLKNADENATKIIQEELAKEEQKIIDIKKKTSINLQALDKNELSEYAKNIDEIEKAKEVKAPLSAANIAKEKIKTFSDRNNEIIAGAKERQAEQTIISAEKAAKDLNIEFNAFETAKEVEEYLGNIKDSKTIAKTKDGFIIQRKDGSQEIVINKEVAKETEAVNVAAHELLHGVLFKTLKDNPQAAINLGQELAGEINKLNSDQIQDSILKRRLDLYKNDPDSVQGEELLALFSDATATGDIKYNENIFTKIGDSIRRLLQDLGFKKIQFNTGRDVYNFIKDYNKGIKEGGVRKAIIDQAAKGFTGKLVDVAKTTQEDVAKFSKSKASDKVQKIYEEQGVGGAMDIIDQFKPIVNKLVNKYRDVPGFEYELLKDEIETGKRGILDMIMAYTPKKAKGAPLAAYINKFLPARMIEAANRNLGTQFTLDVTEAKGITDTTPEDTIEAQEEALIVDEIKSLRKEIGLPTELVTKVKDAVIKTFGTKLPSPENPKFRLELQRRFRTELKKPIAKFVGKQADYESFLRNNFQSIYNKLPQSLINRRFKDFQEPVLDKNGKHVREKTAEGNKVYTKKKITPAEWVKYFLGADVGRSTQGTRKTAIVEAVAEEIAFDATMEVLNRQDVLSKYQEIAEITGEILPDNFKALISKQIDRGESFKFSDSKLNAVKEEYNLSGQQISEITLNGKKEEIEQKYPLLYSYIYDASERIAKDNADLAEKHQLELFNRAEAIVADKKIIEVIDEKIAGDDSSRVDHHLIILGQKTGIEKKLNYTARFGQIELGFEIIDGDIVFNYTSKGEDFINVANYLAGIPAVKNAIIKYATEAGITKNRDKIPVTLKQKLQSKGLQKDIAIKIPVSIEAIKKHYRNKEKDGFKGDYIIIGEDIYHFGKNPLKLDVPELTGEGVLNIRLKLSADSDKMVPVRLIGEYKIPYKTIDKSNRKSIKTDKDFVDLVKNSEFKFSKTLNREFNEQILQKSTGVKWFEEYSPVKARLLSKGKGKKVFIPYSAEDFVGLLYTTLAKGSVGDAQLKWYEDNLLRPFSRGIQQYEAAKQKAMREWADLKKQIKDDVPGGLNKRNETGFRNQDSIRMYIWSVQGMDITGLDPKTINENIKLVRKNPKLKEFAEKLMALNPEGYPEPTQGWDAGDITTDLVSYINDVKRSEFLTEWKDNVDIIFSEKNMNKLKALYGEPYTDALEDILYRMKNGRNRNIGVTKVERAFQNWVNNSIGTIMFFNSRSALLQTISAVNFINFTDNNPIQAAKALSNTKQYADDFTMLFNSDFLKQRRSGLQTDINADEIANAAATSQNKVKATLSAILKFGFTPTQIADSFAIASGGATFYRNRVNKYISDGMTKADAEKKAFTDFQEIAEESQQSARPDRISMQQASSLGRLILAFGNTPMQYARLTKKAALDLANGRGDWKTNVSKIIYYSVIQNIIFSALQQGLFALLFSDEEDEKEKSRYFRIANSSFDTLLRGMGVYGAGASVVKNMIFKIIEESKKGRPDYTKVAIESTALSPPINSKLRKLISAGKTFTYRQSKEKVFTEGFSLENPAFLAGGQILSATTNLPVDRIVTKADHIYTAMKDETELWQSIALSLGWSEWDLNMIEKQTKNAKGQRQIIQRKRAQRKIIQRK